MKTCQGELLLLLSILLLLVDHTLSFHTPVVPCLPKHEDRSNAHSLTCLSSTPTGRPIAGGGVDVINGPFHPDQLQGHWGLSPLLIRQAFSEEVLEDDEVIPSWNQMLDFACDDMLTGDSARLIHHIPGQRKSFQLEWGPLDIENELDGILNGKDEYNMVDNDSEPKRVWTLLLNDADRYMPKLADWLDITFGSFLPRWRRDDAQISIAPKLGGIGPHVDNYDVFLVQTKGTRLWKIWNDEIHKLSTRQEMEALIPDLDVRILNESFFFEKVDEHGKRVESLSSSVGETLHLQPGDLLYLPPRIPHEGISLSDDCQTLSVGCRAPSAAELTARVAEALAVSWQDQANVRYTDDIGLYYGNNRQNHSSHEHPLAPNNLPTITRQVKEDMKQLVRNAVEELMKDDVVWDELVGKLVTESLRYSSSSSYALAEPAAQGLDDDGYYNDDDDDGSDDDRSVSNPSELEASAWCRRPGVSLATSQVGNNIVRLFCHGEMWETTITTTSSTAEAMLGEKENASSAAALWTMLSRLERGQTITADVVQRLSTNMEAQDVWNKLVAAGVVMRIPF